MKKTGWTLIIAMLTLAAYLILWPVPVEPVRWQAPVAPGYTGVHAVNNKLTGIQLIDLGDETGPEHVALSRDGKLYAAMANGTILRMNPDGTAQEVFVNTGGRVLGFDFDAAGNLIAADAIKGLLSIGPDRAITVLADQVNGDPIRYANAVTAKSTSAMPQHALHPRTGAAPSRRASSTSWSNRPPGAFWNTIPPAKRRALSQQGSVSPTESHSRKMKKPCSSTKPAGTGYGKSLHAQTISISSKTPGKPLFCSTICPVTPIT